MRVAVNAHVPMGADSVAPSELRDARIDGERRRLAGARELDAPARASIAQGWSSSRSGMSRASSSGSASPRTRPRRCSRAMVQAFSTVSRTACARQVRGARRALALAEIHGDADAAVALVLDGLDLAEAHGGGEPGFEADIRLRPARRRSCCASASARPTTILQILLRVAELRGDVAGMTGLSMRCDVLAACWPRASSAATWTTEPDVTMKTIARARASASATRDDAQDARRSS